jgi:hypothetical protein
MKSGLKREKAERKEILDGTSKFPVAEPVK